MQKNSHKFLLFIGSMCVSVLLVLFICYLQAKFYNFDYLLNYTFLISALVAVFCAFLWGLKYKCSFEKFIIFMCLLFFNMLIIYVGPLTANRSLSAFIYFYSVENGEVSKFAYSDSYYKDFVKRRYDDGEIFGFLKCDEKLCKPNVKTKIFYYVLMPIAKMTAADKYYKIFKQFSDLQEKN